mgnify:FL=1
MKSNKTRIYLHLSDVKYLCRNRILDCCFGVKSTTKVFNFKKI